MGAGVLREPRVDTVVLPSPPLHLLRHRSALDAHPGTEGKAKGASFSQSTEVIWRNPIVSLTLARMRRRCRAGPECEWMRFQRALPTFCAVLRALPGKDRFFGSPDTTEKRSGRKKRPAGSEAWTCFAARGCVDRTYPDDESVRPVDFGSGQLKAC